MDELDRLAARAAADVRAQAERVADTERALADARAGVHVATVTALPNRRRWVVPAIAAASLVAISAAAVGLARRHDDRRVTSSDTVESTAPATEAPATTDAVITVPATTTPATTSPTTGTTPASTVPAPPVDPVDLGHGLVSTTLPEEPARIRRVDTFGFGVISRADAVTQLWFVDGRGLRVTLGALPSTYSLRNEAAGIGQDGWTLDGLQYEVGAAAGYRLDGDTWLTVESMREYDVAAGGYSDVAFTLDELRPLLAGLTYDPVLDDRVRATTTATERPPDDRPFAPCADGVSVAGNGGRTDLILFTCDGVLARYDGTTGEQVEVIQRFEDPTAPLPADGSGPAYVDTIAVSPDGTTVWFSVGPEPVSDTMYRYVLGSGVAPEAVASGIVGGVSPDGRWAAVVTAQPSIDLIGTDLSVTDPSDDDRRGWDTAGTYVGSPVWSPDSTTIAVDAGSGAIGVLDVPSGSFSLHAPLDGQVYLAPWFDSAGVLHALVDDGTTIIQAVVGPAGNAAPLEVVPETVPETRRVPISVVTDDLFAVLRDGRLELLDATWATGVLAAAVVPG